MLNSSEHGKNLPVWFCFEFYYLEFVIFCTFSKVCRFYVIINIKTKLARQIFAMFTAVAQWPVFKDTNHFFNTDSAKVNVPALTFKGFRFDLKEKGLTRAQTNN